MASTELSITNLNQRIYFLRQQRVMLDSDLAEVYGVQTKRLNEQVKRNQKYFPEGVRFKLMALEFESLGIEYATANETQNTNSLNSQPNNEFSAVANCDRKDGRGGNRELPYAFTLVGVTLLARILRTDEAFEISLAIANAFSQLSEKSRSPSHSDSRLLRMETQLGEILKTLHILIATPPTPLALAAPQPPEQRHLTTQKPVNAHIEKTLTTVSHYYQIKVQELKGSCRRKGVALARQMAMYLLRENLHLGFKEIGLHVGGKDHTTVLHAHRKIEGALQRSEDLRSDLSTLQGLLGDR